jgi:Growth regulator
MAESKATRWGNSLAIRIPASIANEVKITDGTEVKLEVRDGIIEVSRKKYVLSELVAQITEKNKHKEVDWGIPVGSEIW